MSFSPPVAIRVFENREKRVSNSQIPRTGPRTIRGKGRKFGSDTPVRTHGVVFRELWVSLLYPRLGCFSESDLRGWCTGPNETCPPPPPPAHSPLNFDMAVPSCHVQTFEPLSSDMVFIINIIHSIHRMSSVSYWLSWFGSCSEPSKQSKCDSHIIMNIKFYLFRVV